MASGERTGRTAVCGGASSGEGQLKSQMFVSNKGKRFVKSIIRRNSGVIQEPNDGTSDGVINLL